MKLLRVVTSSDAPYGYLVNPHHVEFIEVKQDGSVMLHLTHGGVLATAQASMDLDRIERWWLDAFTSEGT